MTVPFSSPDPSDPTDSSGSHPSVDELADLTEELIEDAAAVEALHRHLAGCAECRETVDALGEVRALLGGVEAPPMPADVAARLDAALADEAARRDASDGPYEAPGSTRGPAAPTPPPRPATAPAAPPARAVGATGPGRPRSRRRRAGLLLGAAAALAAIGLGGALLYPADSGSQKSASSAAAPATADAGHSSKGGHALGGGTEYRDDQLAAQVQKLLAGSGTVVGSPPNGVAKPSAAAPAEGRQPLTSEPAPGAGRTCQAPDAATGTPLATDHGTYAGSPVEVLVYSVPGKPGEVDVYLQSPACTVVLHREVPAH
ncbi:anti-sigma factor family protein [Kitasatospora sp. NPDC059747]|uniref:anti-sigma factor family protein n=1 Tax=Kitasatospora sp. NPDC059747 TaxID=3346930 RepID=UPI00364DF211